MRLLILLPIMVLVAAVAWSVISLVLMLRDYEDIDWGDDEF